MNEATLKEARILMVDDEVGYTCLMANFLNRIGYSRLERGNDSTRIFMLCTSMPSRVTSITRLWTTS